MLKSEWVYRMKHLPNIISTIRIPLSISLILFIHHSLIFITIYLFCGVSDILDGYIARKTKSQSILGAKLDSIADFIMYAMIITILILWDWHGIIRFILIIIIITLIRIVNVGIVYYKFHQFGVIHTIGNKFVGLLAYSIPLFYIFLGNLNFGWIVLFVAVLVSLEETCITIQMKELDLNRKSLFFK